MTCESAVPSKTNPMVKQVVAALMVRGREILCCQRTEYQALPLSGNFREAKSSQAKIRREALVRELEEELGIHAEIGAKVAQLQHRYHNGNAVELHFFVVERFEGELQNRIFREIRWVNRRDFRLWTSSTPTAPWYSRSPTANSSSYSIRRSQTTHRQPNHDHRRCPGDHVEPRPIRHAGP